MIKYDKIKIMVTLRNLTHYLKLGYNAILNQELEILTTHLPSGSHVHIIAVCDICGNEKELRYHKYLDNISRYEFYSCKKCSRQKAALTSIEKYGVDNYSKTDEFKIRVENTNIRKYGYKTNLLSPKYKEEIKKILNEKYGNENFYQINRFKKLSGKLILMNLDNITRQSIIHSESLYKDDNVYAEYSVYRNECRRYTRRNIKKLYENWNGMDYYDGEDISKNFDLSHISDNYPSIDHKISIYYGYINNIPPKIIGDISNLCITKRIINSKKGHEIIEQCLKKSYI